MFSTDPENIMLATKKTDQFAILIVSAFFFLAF